MKEMGHEKKEEPIGKQEGRRSGRRIKKVQDYHLEWRVVGSLITITSETSPNLQKYSFNPSSVVCHERPPTNIFLKMGNVVIYSDREPPLVNPIIPPGFMRLFQTSLTMQDFLPWVIRVATVRRGPSSPSSKCKHAFLHNVYVRNSSISLNRSHRCHGVG